MSLNDKSYDEWVFLKNVAESYELELLTAMLDQQNIPVRKKSKGSGAYTSIYMGTSLTGYDIYVPADRLIEAREMMEDIEPLEDVEATEMETSDEPGGYILIYRGILKR